MSRQTSNLWKLLNSSNYYIVPHLGRIKLKNLHARDCEQMYVDMRKDGLATNTIRLAHVVLNQALKRAVELDFIRYRATEYAKPPSAETIVKYEVLAKPELEELLAFAEFYKWHYLLATLAYSGLRLGEAMALRRQDINLDALYINVTRSCCKIGGNWVFKAPKSASGRRIVDIPDTLVPVLAPRVGKADALVFPNKDGQPSNFRSIEASGKNFVERAGYKPVRLHDLRHSYATMLLEEGFPMRYVCEQLGHSSELVTRGIYSHTTVHNKVRMHGRLTRFFSHTNSHTNEGIMTNV